MDYYIEGTYNNGDEFFEGFFPSVQDLINNTNADGNDELIHPLRIHTEDGEFIQHFHGLYPIEDSQWPSRRWNKELTDFIDLSGFAPTS